MRYSLSHPDFKHRTSSQTAVHTLFLPFKDITAWLMNAVKLCEAVLPMKRMLVFARAQKAPVSYIPAMWTSSVCWLTFLRLSKIRERSCWTVQQHYLGHCVPLRFHSSSPCSKSVWTLSVSLCWLVTLENISKFQDGTWTQAVVGRQDDIFLDL